MFWEAEIYVLIALRDLRLVRVEFDSLIIFEVVWIHTDDRHHQVSTDGHCSFSVMKSFRLNLPCNDLKYGFSIMPPGLFNSVWWILFQATQKLSFNRFPIPTVTGSSVPNVLTTDSLKGRGKSCRETGNLRKKPAVRKGQYCKQTFLL